MTATPSLAPSSTPPAPERTTARSPKPAVRGESARINLRTSPEAKVLIERAAAIMGSTVSSFMLQTAHDAASRILTQRDILTLSDRDRDAFLDALDNPAEPTQALIDLMRLNR
ncbi:MAG: DUF1778 domain-containing protein [Rhodoferax sp.]